MVLLRYLLLIQRVLANILLFKSNITLSTNGERKTQNKTRTRDNCRRRKGIIMHSDLKLSDVCVSQVCIIESQIKDNHATSSENFEQSVDIIRPQPCGSYVARAQFLCSGFQT